MKSVISPITGSSCRLVTELDVSLIKKRYREELNISIDKYMPADGKVVVYECPDTDYRFYYPFTIFGDADFYNQLHSGNKNYYQPWKWENEEALKYISPDDFVLDVGCGEGLFLGELKKRGIKSLYGIDFAASEENGNENDGIKIKRTVIEKYSSENAGKFDVITCFQVLEHITDVKTFIENCLQCLKSGGRLVVAVPNSHPYIYRHDMYHTLNLPPHHAGLWNKGSLQSLCKYFPLEFIYTGFQPIGAELEYYTYIQLQHYLTGNSIFKISLFKGIYARYLHLTRNKIHGHSVIAVYRKK